jgi:DNA-binding IclR family transcriptional regulator
VKLADGIGEFVLLAELRGHAMFALVEARSSRDLAVAYEHCLAERMHVMATGKVLLAWAPDDRRAALLQGLTFVKHGPRTIMSRRALLADLKRTLDRGWALCRDEGAGGKGALGVPVRGPDGAVTAALGCSLPLSRFSPRREKQLVTALQTAAADIERLWA